MFFFIADETLIKHFANYKFNIDVSLLGEPEIEHIVQIHWENEMIK